MGKCNIGAKKNTKYSHTNICVLCIHWHWHLSILSTILLVKLPSLLTSSTNWKVFVLHKFQISITEEWFDVLCLNNEIEREPTWKISNIFWLLLKNRNFCHVIKQSLFFAYIQSIKTNRFLNFIFSILREKITHRLSMFAKKGFISYTLTQYRYFDDVTVFKCSIRFQLIWFDTFSGVKNNLFQFFRHSNMGCAQKKEQKKSCENSIPIFIATSNNWWLIEFRVFISPVLWFRLQTQTDNVGRKINLVDL